MASPHASPADRLNDRSGHPLNLLMVHAHPDDETTTTGATAALYATEGVGVHLVTCTRGERGEILDEQIRVTVGAIAAIAAIGDGAESAEAREAATTRAEEALGEVRADELAAAAKALGITGFRFLGGPGRWWDSGMAGEDSTADPRSFVAADFAEQVAELVAVISEIRPQVVVSYDSNGGYGHPDHIRAHDVTMAAVEAAAAAATPDRWTVAKVYAAVVPHSVLRGVARHIGGGAVDGPNPFTAIAQALDAGVPEDQIAMPFGVPDRLVAARIDARDWLPAKVAAMRAHRSQMAEDGWFFALAEGGDGFGVEHFQLLHGEHGPRQEDGFEADLFAGLRGTADPIDGCGIGAGL
jgi:N-acetyl-1-D-myo-inositol-2-amino-2-deoxy-alpha-D-glucopyranoside deacetylase